MKYQRITYHDGYETITTVTDSGVYEYISKWKDGVITSHYKTTLQNMGWRSLKEFLQYKKGFKKVTQ